jgi:hypothetical protein
MEKVMAISAVFHVLTLVLGAEGGLGVNPIKSILHAVVY